MNRHTKRLLTSLGWPAAWINDRTKTDADYLIDDTSVTVSAVNVSTKTVTYDNLAAAVDAGDWVARAGVRTGLTAAAVTTKALEDEQTEIQGLEGMVTDGAGTEGTSDGLVHPWLHGISGTSSTVWQSYESSVSAVPTDTVFELACDEVNLASGEDVNLGIVSHKGARAYAATLKTQKRFANTVELKGGFSAITFQTGRGEVALWAERDCLDNVAFLVNTSHLTHWVMSDWTFMDRDGAVLNRVANTDAYEATLYKYHEFGTDRRQAHGKLTDLTV